MDQIEFLNKVRKILSKETSFDPDNWTEDNPFYGHCAVITLLAQDSGYPISIETGVMKEEILELFKNLE